MTEGLDNNERTPAVLTTSEMLELAAVDALGLLDEDERAAFDRAFARSPGSVRELVRAEQARIAEMGLLLPDAEAPDALRDKVLARVRAEIERSSPSRGSSHGTPVGASAGQPAGLHESMHAGRGGQAGRSTRHAQGSRPEPRSLGIRRTRRVSAVWRVSAVGAAVAVVVLSVMQVRLQQEIDFLNGRLETSAMIDALGLERIEDVLYADQRVQFVSAGNTGRARATLLRNHDSSTVRLMATNLTSRTDYTVVTLDSSGNVTGELARFESDDLLTTVDMELPGQSGEMVRVAIMSTGENPEPLLVAEFRLA